MKTHLITSLAFLTGIAAADLVGHWPLDADASDATGNGNDGAVMGGAVNFGIAGANASTGTSANFSAEGRITIPYAASLNNPNSFTIATWARPSGTGGFRSILTSRDSAVGTITHGYILYTNNDSPDSLWSFWTGSGGTGASGSSWARLRSDPAAVNQWSHIVMRYDAETLTKSVYINGELSSSEVVEAYSPNGTVNSTDLHIGAGGDLGNEFLFTGDIDDVAIWDERLSVAELNAAKDLGAANAIPDPRIELGSTLSFVVNEATTIMVPVSSIGKTMNLDVTSATAIGDDADHFTVTGALPVGIAPDGSEFINLAFNPLGELGPFNLELELVTNDTINVNPIILAEVIFRDPQISGPTGLDFPGSGAGERSAEVVIENMGGTAALDISQATIEGLDKAFFSISDVPGVPAQIAAGSSEMLTLVFNPGANVGPFSASLVIASNDPVEPNFSIPLTANVDVSISESLIAWWPLDSDSGDASGNGNNGVDTGTIVYGQTGANAATGGAALFDGVSGATVDWSAALNTRSYSVTVWANPSAAGEGAFRTPISSRDDVGVGVERHGWILYADRVGNWSAWNGGGTPLEATGEWNPLDGPAVVLNEWRHLAVTYDHMTNIKTLYIDGVENASISPVASSPNNSTLLSDFTHEDEDLRIGFGGDEGGEFGWEGLIDDIGLFRTALTAEQIASIATNGVGSVVRVKRIEVISADYVVVGAAAQVNLEWKPFLGVNTYAIDRAIGTFEEESDWINVGDSEATTFTDFTPPVGKVFYRIRADD